MSIMNTNMHTNTENKNMRTVLSVGALIFGALLISLAYFLAAAPGVGASSHIAEPYVTKHQKTYTTTQTITCQWTYTDMCICNGTSFLIRNGCSAQPGCGSYFKHGKNTCGQHYCTNDPKPSTPRTMNVTQTHTQTTRQCHYISEVTEWSECVNGTQVATNVTWSTKSGSTCSNTLLTRSCENPPGNDDAANDDDGANDDGRGDDDDDGNDDGNDDDANDDDDGVSGPPEIIADPNLIDNGETTTVAWFPNGGTNCVITSSQNDSKFSGREVSRQDPPEPGEDTSSPIFGEVRYTLTCDNGTDDAFVRVREQIEDF